MKPHEWRWAIRDAPLDRACKNVAWALATRMNSAGECWPSKAQLIADTGYTKRTVDIAIHRLEVGGLITVRRGGGPTPNHYLLRGAMVAPLPRLEGCNKQQSRGATIAPEEEIEEERHRGRPLTAYAAAAAVTVDAAMLTLARGWLEAH